MGETLLKIQPQRIREKGGRDRGNAGGKKKDQMLDRR